MNAINENQTNITKQTGRFIDDIKWQIDFNIGMFEFCDNKEEVEKYATKAYTLAEVLYYTNAISEDEHKKTNEKIYEARYKRIFNELEGRK